jgi:hypothetical protein
MTHSSTAVANQPVATTVLSITLAMFALLTVLLLLQENGLLIPSGAAHYLHEVTHDARHALGVPCH